MVLAVTAFPKMQHEIRSEELINNIQIRCILKFLHKPAHNRDLRLPAVLCHFQPVMGVPAPVDIVKVIVGKPDLNK
jgi:hypothetical protein